ncbi:hypothetical protein J3R83DRAFT_7944 [Lanmaoa asiatica]|nr:hypothetical protein J3R83DRAFT_7944 [Lanmaoa asiatica]
MSIGPWELKHTKSNQTITDRLTQHTTFQRAAGFMCSAFAFYAPKLYQEYQERLDLLFAKNPNLKKVFKNSIFPTCTFNCGLRVMTLEHVDSTNVPFGLCAIFACGSYNPTQGGHLILFDFKLVIQFPPGSTILVLSDTIWHGNVAIQPHSTRQSFTQYCPGGLFCWVEYGFQLAKSLPVELKNYFSETHDACCK